MFHKSLTQAQALRSGSTGFLAQVAVVPELNIQPAEHHPAFHREHARAAIKVKSNN